MDWGTFISSGIGLIVGSSIIQSLPALLDLIFGRPNKKEVNFVWTWGIGRNVLSIIGAVNSDGITISHVVGSIITVILCTLVSIKYRRHRDD